MPDITATGIASTLAIGTPTAVSQKAWSDWYNDVLPDVPGCPELIAANAIKLAAIEFCERSFVYLVDHAPIDATDGTGEYDWAPDGSAKVVRPETVWYDKKELTPVTRDQLADMHAYWPDWEGTPLYFVQEQLEKLIVVPKPDADLSDGIRAKVSIRPSQSAGGIHAFIWEKYLEPIASGAKARLFAMKRKPWTDGALASYHKGVFDDAIDKARLASFKGHVRSRNNQNRNFRRFM